MIRSIFTFSIIIAVCILTPQQSSGQNRFIRHGFHAGIGVTGAVNRFQLTAERTTNQYTEQKVDRSFSVLGNVFAGYGYTIGQRLFFGAEAGISIPKRTGEVIRQGVVFTGGSYTDHLSVRDVLTGDLLLGYRLINRSLFYLRAGGSWARIHIDQDPTPSIPNSSFSDSAYKFGARMGIGLYYHLTDRLGISIDHTFTVYQPHTPLWKEYDLQFNHKVSSNFLMLSAIFQFQ
jgi:opacity protein-like surface antigen